MADILASGVSQLPSHWEESLLAQNAWMSVGGGAANSAVTFSRLGESVKLLARIGNDGFGEFIESILKREEVSTDFIVRDKNLSTGIAVGIVHKDGRRCFIVARGANAALNSMDTDTVRPEETSILHVNGYFQIPGVEHGMEDVLERFMKAGTVISFDTASWDPSGRWYDSIRHFSRYIDYFFANNAQLSKLTGLDDMQRAAEVLMKDGVKNVIVKLGADGCTTYDASKATHVDGYTVAVVDTTGAGDSFDAAYLTGVLKGWDTRKCAMFANIVAALNCTKPGATAGVPSYDKALGLLERNM